MALRELPTEKSKAADYARRLLRGFGTALRAPDGSVNAADFLGLGDILASVDDMIETGIDQFFVNTATWMLEGWERIYGLPTDVEQSDSERQAALLSKVRAARAGTPNAIKKALSSITTSIVHENRYIDLSAESKIGVYTFAVQIPVAVWSDVSKRDIISQVIEQMKPAHMKANLAVTVGFLCDDPSSLCDRDVLGT